MTRKLKSYKSDRVPPGKMILRMVEIRRETFSEKDKSVEVVIASENPVERFDEDRQEVIREILMMDGIKYRNNTKQLPIVDSHDRSTVRNVLGSVRNLRTENGALIGDASFARDEDSQIAFQKLQDGHLTDFSITATPNDITSLQRGETASFGENVIDGPADIVTNWTPTDASLVAAGADENSTVRTLMRSYQIPVLGVIRMKDATRTALLGRGMPEDMVDAEDALEFILSRMEEEEAAKEEEGIENAEGDEEEEVIEKAEEEEEKKPETLSFAVDRALKSDRKRQKEIRAICSRAGIKRAYADQLCDSGTSLKSAREKVLERMIAKPLGTSDVRVTKDGDESFTEAIRDGLITRALNACPPPPHKKRQDPFDGRKRAPGAEQFERRSLLRVAEEILQRGGINTRTLTNRDIAMIAMGHRSTIERHRSITRDAAWHTTGTFSNLLLDAKNKTLQAGYNEAEFTWNIWARQGPSVEDFKDIHRVRFSESPDPAVVPEGTPYPEKTTADARETYRVEKYGAIWTTTWESVVNDDLDGLSRIPAMHGAACRRKQNKLVYGILTANANMSDGNPLFDNTNHGNDTADTVISVINLNTAYTAMMIQTGLRGEIIGVVPRFLLCPPGISGTALQIVTSMSDPAVANDTAVNLYRPGGERPLRVVVEPQLQANDANAWYLAASTDQIDTIELTFLAGEESPVLESEWEITDDTLKNKVRQTMGAAAIDWRGLLKNDGA